MPLFGPGDPDDADGDDTDGSDDTEDGLAGLPRTATGRDEVADDAVPVTPATDGKGDVRWKLYDEPIRGYDAVLFDPKNADAAVFVQVDKLLPIQP